MKTNQNLPLLCSSIVSLAALTAVPVSAQTLAFPGAQGFGANATGGRAGTVYHVTTLADSGAGSFRDAVSSGNRIVVFDVGGYISLSTAVSVNGNNITIAGQTAPGGGIGFKGGEISFASRSNIICRYIRVRPGSDTASSTDDALSLYRARYVILDHTSFEFAPWNNIDGVSDDWQAHPVTDITIQNSIIADPTGQQFAAHTESVSSTWAWYNNIFANSHNRNPLAKINTVFVNNVLYNCSAGYTTHTSTLFDHDIVNNYFISGPATGASTDFPWFQVDKNQSIYYSGNLFDSDRNSTLGGSTTTPYWYQGPGTILTSPWSSWTTGVTIVSPASAFRRAVSQSGALPYDEIDALVVSQVKTLGNGTTGTGAGTVGPDGALYTSQTQTGLGNNGYGTISGGTASTDTDGDGMPDYWERAMGWNINSADSMVIVNGYTRLEAYINWLADPHVTGNANSTIDLNLSTYAGGFVNSPVFSVGSPSNGSVSLLADGHTARFTPTAGFYGLGKYNFTVTDSAGSTMTLTVGVLVQPTPPPVPTGLSATPGNAQVTVNWSASAGALGYNVYRATSSSGPFSSIASVPGTSYLNTGLVNGTTYFFTVASTNAFGTSAQSAYIGATPSGGSTGVTNTIQAEAGTIAGGTTIDSNNAGFNGTGFANFPTTGGSLQFSSVAGGSGGAGTLTVRYALGITTSRTGQLVVNNVTNSITFNPSGAWTTWTNKVVNITLNSGTGNTIRFQSNGQDMGNIDQITVAKP